MTHPLRLSLTALALVVLPACVEQPDPPEPEADPADVEASTSPPPTDLYLVELAPGLDGLPRPGAVRRLTDRRLYDNQPFFLPGGGAVVYTAGREDGGTDIRLLDLETGAPRPLMVTSPESEYSPTPFPDGSIVVVRVESDGTQRLWRFPMGSDAVEGDRAELALPDVEPVGYHAWLDDDRVALFVLGSPATLHLAELSAGGSRAVFEGIGPSLQKIPGEDAVSFVETGGDGVHWIRRLDGATEATERIVETVDGGVDHAWTPGGVLLMASGRELLAFRPGVDEGWQSLGPVGPEGVQWSRIAVSPAGDRLVIVGP